MRVRLVVADQAQADFYDMEHADEAPRFAGGVGDPLAHLHDRDFVSDRPGRVFDHASSASGRRGATAHHGTGGERKPRRQEAGKFARQIANLLDAAHRNGEFERLVLMAPPGFMGALREALPDSLRSTVAAEIGKDLVHAPASRVRSYLPPGLFARPVPRA